MEGYKRMRVAALAWLFFTGYILVPAKLFGNVVQEEPAPFKVEGTTYEGAIVTLPPSLDGLRLLHTYYIFEAEGKVRCRRTIIRLAHDTTTLRYNPTTKRYDTIIITVPGEHISTDEIGKYRQLDNVIRMEFADRYIQATYQTQGSVRGLDGVTTFKNSDKKERFMVIDRPSP